MQRVFVSARLDKWTNQVQLWLSSCLCYTGFWTWWWLKFICSRLHCSWMVPASCRIVKFEPGDTILLYHLLVLLMESTSLYALVLLLVLFRSEEKKRMSCSDSVVNFWVFHRRSSLGETWNLNWLFNVISEASNGFGLWSLLNIGIVCVKKFLV
jgi:hypothetical protein